MRLLVGLFLMFHAAIASAIVVDFEEDWAYSGVAPTPGYGGLSYSSNWKVWDNYSSPNYPQGSGTDALYVEPATAINTIGFSGLADLNSVWLATNLSYTYTFHGYDASDNLLYTSATYSNFDGTVNLGWQNIAYFDITSSVALGSRYFILDDINYDLVEVPIPATLTLIGLGLVGLGYTRKRAS